MVLANNGMQRSTSLVLTFDNQVLDPMTHDPSHNCGQDVHACTQEPDTHIIQVRVNGNPIGPCETVDATTGTLEIDFLAHLHLQRPAPAPAGHATTLPVRKLCGPTPQT
jgi:hypothetical protein